MTGFDFLAPFIKLAAGHGSRSTVLKSISWLIGLLLTAILIAISISAPSWILETFVNCFWIAFGLFILAFIFFMFKSPDALRSERFTIQKMAIERGLVGDSRQGLMKEKDIKTLPSSGSGEL